MNADEDFDISFVTAIESSILVHLGQAHINTIHSQVLIKILIDGTKQGKVGSNNPFQAVEAPLSPPLSHGESNILREPTSTAWPRERFALACFSALFKICSHDKEGSTIVIV